MIERARKSSPITPKNGSQDTLVPVSEIFALVGEGVAKKW